MNIERLKELLEIPFSTLSVDNINELTEFYKFIYGAKVCTSCKNRFAEYYKRLSESGVDRLTVKTESNFKLRPDLGVMQINFDDGTFISQTYAPDDLCIGFLQANPNRISMFEKYPMDWMELIQNNENEMNNE